ncbi:MAG: tetratricopeptide repeat protein [Pseudomonadota bacterium]
MATPLIANLEKLLGTPRDGALLRFSLGMEYLKIENTARATEYLRAAVEKDPGYSAAWRSLGKALEAAGQTAEALDAYRSGIAAAQKKGDKQAEKEMTVYARRIEKKLAG